MTKPILILAPMDDVTDTVFRKIVASCAAPDLFFTEFVNVDGLQSPGRAKLLHKLALIDEPHPVIAQIWGKDPTNFEKTACEIADGSIAHEANKSLYGDMIQNFAGIDINFGCPDKTVVRNAACSAMIKPENRELAVEIIKAVQKGANGKIPVSVKTRLGFEKIDHSWHELLLKQKLNMLSIHARTVKEMSKVPAHWDELIKIVAMRDQISPETKIIINGDIKDRQHALEIIQQTGVDGVMIGRGIFADPFCFASPPAGGSPWSNMTKNQKIALFRKHVELFQKTWQHGERRFETLKKFVKIYISDFDGASDLRDQIMKTKTTGELPTVIDTYTTTNTAK